MKSVQRFQNVPTDKTASEVVAETKGSLPIGGMFITGLKILVAFALAFAIVGFLGFKVYQVGRDVVMKRQEILFAIQHQDMVKPIRELYEKSHQQADGDLKQILTGGK